MTIQIYAITGLTCGKCVAKLQAALMPFAQSVTVTLTPPQAVLTNPTADLATLNSATASAGDYRLTTEALATKSWLVSYYPLLLIVSYILIASFASADNWHSWMQHFMAGFFLVFSFFKLLNLSGFVMAYRRYDLIAAQLPTYAFVYPFLEAALGFAYLFNVGGKATLWVTLILMTISAAGVINALRQKKELTCACLGSTLNLPLSSVALIEDLGMAAMAAAMLTL